MYNEIFGPNMSIYSACDFDVAPSLVLDGLDAPLSLGCFKAYDVRGLLDRELTPCILYRMGRAFGHYVRHRFYYNPKATSPITHLMADAPFVVVGSDARASSVPLKRAFVAGLFASGVGALDLGLCGTEEVYFATGHFGALGGCMVTASHNPIEYNGLKLVGQGATPIGMDTGLKIIRDLTQTDRFLAQANAYPAKTPPGRPRARAYLNKRPYLLHLLSFVDVHALAPKRILLNSGNGAAGHTLMTLLELLREQGAPITPILMHNTPDARFPNGIPNPMLPINQDATANKIRKTGADFGVAFDGDFDRCFLFDHQGRFVDGALMVALLGKHFLRTHPGDPLVYDGRLVYAVQEVLNASGGRGIMSVSGHSNIKQTMRAHNAIYGGELSAHHYFRDFYYCDSGMLVWLLVWSLVADAPLCALVDDMRQSAPNSGELNFTFLGDADALFLALSSHFAADNPRICTQDGLSLEFDAWRFNVRTSNTEPLIRLNIETRADLALLKDKTDALLCVLDSLGAQPNF